MAKRLTPFLIGAAAGAVVALLTAKRTGAETRILMADKLNTGYNAVTDFSGRAANTAVSSFARLTGAGVYEAADAGNTAEQGVHEIAGSARDFVSEVTQRGVGRIESYAERGREVADAAYMRTGEIASSLADRTRTYANAVKSYGYDLIGSNAVYSNAVLVEKQSEEKPQIKEEKTEASAEQKKTYTRFNEPASTVTPAFSSQNDDVKRRIDEAHARIAAQAIKNARESIDAVAASGKDSE
ncbi:MAG: hypothetical protein J6Y65_01790 [Eggerthellaceae bacterium]|nr:hypothetical protein [Eggerthellaceae bacterium]